jgi:hypothetical protein
MKIWEHLWRAFSFSSRLWKHCQKIHF